MLRNLARPRRRTRDPKILKEYWEIAGGMPCEWGVLQGTNCQGQELNHLLCGQRKEDAFWNLVLMCRIHHQDQKVGFHGVMHHEMLERLLQLKIEQGFILPREAYAYLPEGIDAAPQDEADEAHNRLILQQLAEDWQMRQWSDL